jgi:hypothetical protein
MKTAKMDILKIPSFIKYFKVSDADEEFFEEAVLALAELASNDYYVMNGVTYMELLNELNHVDFLIASELTDHEPHSVMNAQFVLNLMTSLQVIPPTY